MEVPGIPACPTPLVGRSEELAAIGRLMADADCRLLTLTGPGGIGKTRLAIEVAARLRDDRKGRAFFVPLQQIASPDEMIRVLAETVGFQLQPEPVPRQQVLGYFRDKSILLVLDNLEHLLDSVDLLSDLLMSAPQLRILATSRERLRLLEEWVFEIPALAVPESLADADLDRYPAAELFLHHARRANAGSSATEFDHVSLYRICRLVGGMPLALEIAAGWARMMPLAQIAAEIETSLEFLRTNTRNLETRHRSIRAVFEPAWERLSEAERSVFQRLSIFRGGFTRGAAEAVAGASLTILSALADKSLIQVQPDGRYDLHELLRQYSEEKRSTQPEQSQALLERYADYFSGLLDRSWALLTSHHQKQTMAELIQDIENIRRAWRIGVEQRNVSALWASFRGFWFVHDVQGWYLQGIALVTEAEACLQFLSPTDDIEALSAALDSVHAYWLGATGLPREGMPLAREALDELESLDRPEALLFAYSSLCLNALLMGTLYDYVEIIRSWVQLAQSRDDRWHMAVSTHFLGMAYRAIDPPFALQTIRDSLRIAEETGDLFIITNANTNLGELAFNSGNLAEAQYYHQRALDAAIQLRYRAGRYRGTYHLGLLACANRNYPEALRLYRQCLQIADDAGLNSDILDTLFRVAQIEGSTGYKAAAVEKLTLLLRAPYSFWRREDCARYLKQLEAELSPGVFLAAVGNGQRLELAGVIAGLLSEPDQHPDSDAVNETDSWNVNLQLVEPLSRREWEILRLLAEGFTNAEIAARLVVDVSTIKKHINHAYSKLAVSSRAEAISRTRELGLV